jgi:hypothetical protein
MNRGTDVTDPSAGRGAVPKATRLEATPAGEPRDPSTAGAMASVAAPRRRVFAIVRMTAAAATDTIARCAGNRFAKEDVSRS